MKPKGEIGDIVKLKSGGPNMTIMHIRESADRTFFIYKCSWFTESGSLLQDSFPEETLVPVEST